MLQNVLTSYAYVYDSELPHDKTNKNSMSQISLGIRPVWSESCPHEESLGP